MLNIDGQTMYLSDLRDAGMIENCGWLSNLFRSVVKTVVAVVVRAVVPPVVTYAVLTFSGMISRTVRANNNLSHNQKQYLNANSYVYGQGALSNWKFGAMTMDRNGCGVVATYNVFQMLAKKGQISKAKLLKDIVYDFDFNGGDLAWGYFGADPSHLTSYFRRNGLRYATYSSIQSFQTAISRMNKNQVFVMCSWNEQSFMNGAHYIAGQKVGSKLEVYNRYGWQKEYSYEYGISNVRDIFNGNLILGYIIN